MITSKQRAFLRGQAQPLNAIYQIGKTGFTEESVRGIEEALNARELIKIHVLENCMYSAKEAGALLAEELGCECVQTIGSKIVLFKQKNTLVGVLQYFFADCCLAQICVGNDTVLWHVSP